MRRFLSILLCGVAAASPALALKPGKPLPYVVSAPADAVYRIDCRFRKFEVEGKMNMKKVVNSMDLSGKGPKKGQLPTDNARCTLKQTAGRGPVVLTVTKDKPYVASVAKPGATTQLFVL